MIVDFCDYEKMEVLRALWYYTQFTGIGSFFRERQGKPNKEEFKKALNVSDIKFICGKPIYVNFKTFPKLDSKLYDKCNNKHNYVVSDNQLSVKKNRNNMEFVKTMMTDEKEIKKINLFFNENGS